ncbi:MAG: hypothetical protein L0226_00490, partial [Acidobacteria bacterium]|nr:hypothetical protein [Acidobacteriota bacterium]
AGASGAWECALKEAIDCFTDNKELIAKGVRQRYQDACAPSALSSFQGIATRHGWLLRNS